MIFAWWIGAGLLHKRVNLSTHPSSLFIKSATYSSIF